MDIDAAIECLEYETYEGDPVATLIAAYRAQEQEIAAARRLLGEVLNHVKGAMTVLDGGVDASR